MVHPQLCSFSIMRGDSLQPISSQFVESENQQRRETGIGVTSERKVNIHCFFSFIVFPSSPLKKNLFIHGKRKLGPIWGIFRQMIAVKDQKIFLILNDWNYAQYSIWCHSIMGMYSVESWKPPQKLHQEVLNKFGTWLIHITCNL